MCFGDIDGTMWFYPANIKRTGKRIKAAVIGDPRMYYAVHTKGLAISNEDDEKHFNLFHYAPIQDPKVKSFAIVDSGTTLLIVPKPTWDSMVAYFQNKFCHLPGVCESPSIFERPNDYEAICLTESPYESFPTLGIVIGDAVLRLPSSLYFIEYKKSVYCLGIQPGPVMIIGDSVLRGFTVSYETKDVIFLMAHAM